MNRTEKMDRIMESECGARALLDVIVGDYGAPDVVDCLFYGLNTDDQDRLLDAALQKAGA
jgi:hypothetical protein